MIECSSSKGKATMKNPLESPKPSDAFRGSKRALTAQEQADVHDPFCGKDPSIGIGLPAITSVHVAAAEHVAGSQTERVAFGSRVTSGARGVAHSPLDTETPRREMAAPT